MSEARARSAFLALFGLLLAVGPTAAQSRQDVPAPALWELRAANACLQKQDCDCAIPALERAVQLYSSYVDALVALSYCYFQKGRYDDAIARADAVVNLSKREPLAFLTRGMAYEQQGKYEPASANYEAAIKLKRADPAAHLGLARVSERLGNKERAIEQYKAVLDQNPQNIGALTSLSQLYVQTSRPKDAEEALKEVLKLNPDNPSALMRLGSLYIETKQFDRAVESLQAVLKIDYNQPIIHFRLGEVYVAAGKTDAALTHYSVAAELDPNFVQAKMALARLRVQLKQIQPALELFDQVIAAGKGEFLEEATVQKIQLLLQAGQTAKAAESADIALGVFPENPTFVRLAAQRRSKAGQGAQALELALRLTKANDKDPEAWRLRGSLELATGDMAAAETSLTKAVALDATDAVAFTNLGYLAASAGRKDEAQGFLDRALAIQPEQAAALNNLAVLKLDSAPAESVEFLSRAAKVNPDSPVVKNNLAVAQARTGKAPEALALLKSLVAVQPAEVDWRWNLSMVLIAQGEGQAALELLQPLAGEGPGAAGVWRLLGDINYKLGQFEQSETAYRKSLDLLGNEAKAKAAVLYNLGTTFLARERRRPRALAPLSEAAQLDPQLAEAQNNLGCLSFFSDRTQEARQFFRAALKLRPGDKIFLLNLVSAGEVVSDEQIARAQQLSDEDRSMAETRVGDSLLAQGYGALASRRWAEAVSALTRAREAGVRSAELENAVAIALIRLQRFDEAAERLSAALELAPLSAEALLNMALLQDVHAKDAEAALGFYERYLKVTQDPKISRYVERKKRFQPALVP